ncbi:MAG: hypothetical protein ACJASQ_002714 [Crocinitomicaceae bacterium]|jgi:hypothetical protein
MENIKKKWVKQRFNKWVFEYLVYDEDTTYQEMDVVKGRIPNGGLILKNIYHADYRMAHDIRVNAIWVYPGATAEYENFKPKQLVLGIPDFEQIEVKTSGGVDGFDVIKYDKSHNSTPSVGKRSGIPYNFYTYINQVEGEIFVKWKSKEKIFGENSDYLYITQKYVFTKYASLPAHDPTGGVNAARLHPMTKVYYSDRSDGYFDSVRVDYRMHLNLDTYPTKRILLGDRHSMISYYDKVQSAEPLKNHVGVFKDEDTFELGYTANRAIFASAEKPIVAEIESAGILGGKNSSFGTDRWDNLHWWGAGGLIHASAPGAFHAIHMHWRWGTLVHEYSRSLYIGGVKHSGKPQFKGRSKGGILTDPDIANQSISFAVVKNRGIGSPYANQSSEQFNSFFKKLRNPESTNTKPEGGHDFVLYYSGRVFKGQNYKGSYFSSPNSNLRETAPEPIEGYLFLHGLYFAHETEKSPGTVIGSQSEYYIYPPKNKIDKTKWRRNPQI